MLSRMPFPVSKEDRVDDEVTRELHSFLFIPVKIVETEQNFTCGP